MRLGWPNSALWALPLLALTVCAHGGDDNDPLALARGNLKTRVGNVVTGVPPQCYTKTGTASNPCWVCHVRGRGDNRKDDHDLQAHYDFTPTALTNHWGNLFRDRRVAMAAIPDGWMLEHLQQDNYTPLRLAMQKAEAEFTGYRPDLDLTQGFDADGFARDGSGWRAYRYKPFPGTFWPTNGSSDAAFIRLPSAFRRDAAGHESRAIYKANLNILEAAIASPDRDKPLALPPHFSGGAQDIAVRAWRYPEGTELLHPVWYVNPEATDQPAMRMKELRYAIKAFDPNEQTLKKRYAEEAHEQAIGDRPHYSGTALLGETNGWGWRYQGYIEDAQGRLRLQTNEEQLSCMGCHSSLGVTVDSSFSLPRKLPGAPGWGMQDLRRIPDAPQHGSREPEYQRYLRRVRAGDEFRANTEMLARFFPRGMLDLAAVQRASTPGIAALISPSRARALALAKAYTVTVQEQSYTQGRDVVLEPAQNVHRQLANTDTPLKASSRVYQDGRLWLDWNASTKR